MQAQYICLQCYWAAEHIFNCFLLSFLCFHIIFSSISSTYSARILVCQASRLTENYSFSDQYQKTIHIQVDYIPLWSWFFTSIFALNKFHLLDMILHWFSNKYSHKLRFLFAQFLFLTGFSTLKTNIKTCTTPCFWLEEWWVVAQNQMLQLSLLHLEGCSSQHLLLFEAKGEESCLPHLLLSLWFLKQKTGLWYYIQKKITSTSCTSEIWSSHSSEYEEGCLLGCSAV
jgi:hypothetical protein